MWTGQKRLMWSWTNTRKSFVLNILDETPAKREIVHYKYQVEIWKYNNMKQIFPLLNTITGVWELIEQESQYHTQEQGQETMNPTERIPCHTLVKPSWNTSNSLCLGDCFSYFSNPFDVRIPFTRREWIRILVFDTELITNTLRSDDD